MKILKTRRLGILADLTPEGARVADVGTDHAWLPIALVAAGRATSAIGIDRLPGPLRHAQQHVARAGLRDRVALRLGDGLRPLGPNEADAVIMAGMGGLNMAQILREAAPSTLATIHTLILQPNCDLAALRAHLLDTGWHIHHEQLVEARGRFYVTLLVRDQPDPDAAPYTEAERCLGRLTPDAPDALARWRDQHASTLQTRLDAMRLAAEVPPERAEVERELGWLRDLYGPPARPA